MAYQELVGKTLKDASYNIAFNDKYPNQLVAQVNYKNGRIAVQPTWGHAIYTQLQHGLYSPKAKRERDLLNSKIIKVSIDDLSSKSIRLYGTNKALKLTVNI